ncbi:flagellar basal-body rod protein FlgF [bacterium]|nr:flagellar basal-body rod protein FlgF [bacterium]
MSDGLYTAMSGGMGTSKHLDITSHNLANIDTTGYKKEKTIFASQLAEIEFNLLEAQAKDVDMPQKVLPVDKHNVVVTETFTDFQQGVLKKTDNPLDLAIQGDGFFKIDTPQGVRYTRDGSFFLSKENKVVTSDGYPLLNKNNQSITLPNGKITINESGTIFSNNEEIANIAVVTFQNINTLSKEAKTFFSQTDQNQQEIEVNSTIHQGFLEGANVNPIEEMVNLISLHRTFEMNTRVIETFGELNRKAATDVGRV